MRPISLHNAVPHFEPPQRQLRRRGLLGGTSVLAAAGMLVAALAAAPAAQAASAVTITPTTPASILDTSSSTPGAWQTAGPLDVADTTALATSALATIPAGLNFVDAPLGYTAPGGPSNMPGGNYFFQLSFDLSPDINPATFGLSTTYSADDEVAQIWVNGAAQNPEQTSDLGYGPTNATAALAGVWHTGTNVVTFQVYNVYAVPAMAMTLTADFNYTSLALVAPAISTSGVTSGPVTGTGVPGATVTVTNTDGSVTGTTTVDADGTWNLPLPDGAYNLTATQAAGNATTASTPSNTTAVTVDTTAPTAPAITSPVSDSITGNASPTITGTGEPGATVTVTDGDTELGTATVNDKGEWSLTPTQPLTDGTHTITATQTDPAGNTSPASTVNLTVDTTAPTAPTITAPAGGTTTKEATPAITGTGEPGATVTVTDGDTELGTATVNDKGEWSLTPTQPLTDGTHTITATQTDPAGNTSPASTVNLTVDTTAPTAPSITDGTGSHVSGTGEPGATVILTDSKGNVIGRATVGDNGIWNADLSPVQHAGDVIGVTQVDAAGNVSPTATYVFEEAAVTPTDDAAARTAAHATAENYVGAAVHTGGLGAAAPTSTDAGWWALVIALIAMGAIGGATFLSRRNRTA